MNQVTRQIVHAILRHAVRLPSSLLELLFGEPPTNDRGVRLDGQTHAFLNILEAIGNPPLEELGAEKARKAYIRAVRLFEAPPRPVQSVTEKKIPGADGELDARIYRAGSDGPGRALVYFHGGGFVIGGLDTHDGLCRRFAHDIGCPVISVAYRRAPEHPFPAAVEDCVAALEWAFDNADRYGWDRERIAVGGDSAGAHLATVATQQLIETGAPTPSHQLLIYPVTDYRKGDYPSMELFSEGFFLDGTLLTWFSEQFLQGYEDFSDPRVSPIAYPDLGEMPPAYVVTAGFDPLRDKGEAYVEALADADVRVEHHSCDTLIHGFVTQPGIIEAADRTMSDIGEGFRDFWDS